MIRAAFFDIDGTLLPFGVHTLPDSTRIALCKLRENGVLLFVATGRCRTHLQQVLDKMDFSFDGYVIMNGQYCYTADDETVWTLPFDKKDVDGILAFHEKYPGAMWCMDELRKRHYNTLYEGDIQDIDRSDPTLIRDILSQMIAEGRKLYQVSATLTPEQEKEVEDFSPGCFSVHWHPVHVDIIPKNGGKYVGIEKMLAHYGLTYSQTIAFGDGGNDIGMIKAAEIGVAMGNAGDHVKQQADYITTNTENDGIYNALVHFGLI